MMALGSKMLEPDFLHGTVAGYDEGCKGGSALCPADIPCRDVWRRYKSDVDFRRLIDAGVPLIEIVALDQAAAAHDAEVERRRRRGQPDPAPLTLNAADAAAARRPVPSPPSIRPAELVQPVPDVDEETGEPITADTDPALQDPETKAVIEFLRDNADDLGLRPEAITAPERPRKWAVRKVWVAIAPDGSLHGPFEDDAQARVYVSAQFPAPVTIPPADHVEAVTEAHSDVEPQDGFVAWEKPKQRARRPWTADDTRRLHVLWKQGLSDGAIGREMDRSQPIISARRRRAGLAANGGQFGNTPKTTA